jgi:hypothetical protein
MSLKLKWPAKNVLAAGVLLFVTLAALAQGDWSLGPYRLTSGRPSAPLQYSLAGSGGLGSYRFVSGVGGVAFGGIARPDASVKDRSIVLHYDTTTTDGHHLQVLAGDVTATADLPDWMLIPIANFANSESDACVSLFGPDTNAVAYDIVYHQAFKIRCSDCDFCKPT